MQKFNLTSKNSTNNQTIFVVKEELEDPTMNWSWRGINNGLYSSGNFNPGDRTYNWRTSMITNIKPQ